MIDKTYRIFNNPKIGQYQQVSGLYPYHEVLQTFSSFTQVLNFIIPRVHLEEGALNFFQFLVGTTLSNEAISVQTLLEEGKASANSDVYLNRAVRMLEKFVNSGRGWRTDESKDEAE